jgi:membrane protein DedA with SNARE-associated domain
VWQITLLRIVLVIVAGSFLYCGLLYLSGWGGGRHLKKREKASLKEQENLREKIVLVYFIFLFTVVTLCFLIIKYWIRGVE